MSLLLALVAFWSLFWSANALQIAALGSSFAAGFGLPAGKSYASLLANRLGARLNDLSASGTTLLDIPWKISSIARDTDIVTITSGGNDLGYVAGLMFNTNSMSSEDEVTARYNKVLEGVRRQAPNSTIYVVEYLTIFGTDARPGQGNSFDLSRLRYHQNVAITLQRATAKAADGKPGVHRIPVAKESVGHGLGSREPWVNGQSSGFFDGAAWHPNAAGMKAIADMLYKAIKP